MSPLICEALKRRILLYLFYGGGQRLVEPHCCGVSREGEELLRAYQIWGHSGSGKSEGWKLFRVDRASEISLIGVRFQKPRPLYKHEDWAMATIYCRL